ncbi:hypothetical protein GYMLUDRAFT_700433 [Collybiopsis luxurians FD-317 M1]|uniref:F-box domain-containing protein n=1 Tax=Collybiopsis luxurians FD-317 M1 TaxID=944289 RepID=A0A0D0BSB5_9AGAR|nr:hypothetical protein GYMLUDRAFT_700433 [Collybiopsis luxurians FD-317 M1]
MNFENDSPSPGPLGYILPSLSPISSLPNELLLSIFDAVRFSDEVQVDQQDSIRCVSQVCRRWRNLALEPSFWQFVYISQKSIDLTASMEDPHLVDEASIFPWVTTVLGRSQTLPLDVVIELWSDSFDPVVQESESESERNFFWTHSHSVVLSRILTRYASQLYSVTISSQIWRPLQDIGTCLIGVQMPLLQEWSVNRENPRWRHAFCSGLEPGATMPALEAPRGINVSMEEYTTAMFPSLRFLSLSGSLQDWTRFTPSNLRAIDLKYIPLNCRPTYQELKALLLASQFSLESLTLWGAMPIEMGQKITLPNLHSLSLGFSFPEAALCLPYVLDVPNLEQLEIYHILPQNHLDSAGSQSMDEILISYFYLAMIHRWPLNQLTHLALRSPFFPFGEFEELDVSFREKRQGAWVPVLLSFFLQCTSVTHLSFLDPDKSTLRALVSPVWMNNVKEAIVPFCSLRLLHIETEDHVNFMDFLDRLSCCDKADHVLPRRIGSMTLEGLLDWGEIRDYFASDKWARKDLTEFESCLV